MICHHNVILCHLGFDTSRLEHKSRAIPQQAKVMSNLG